MSVVAVVAKLRDQGYITLVITLLHSSVHTTLCEAKECCSLGQTLESLKFSIQKYSKQDVSNSETADETLKPLIRSVLTHLQGMFNTLENCVITPHHASLGLTSGSRAPMLNLSAFHIYASSYY